jgi:arabinogalactan endo-1,4-beta-galactosidase
MFSAGELCMCFAAVAQKRQWLLAVAATIGLGGALAKADPFYTGADVSLLTFFQQQQALPPAQHPVPTFKDNGVAANGDQIIYDAGANLFRLRIFVNPQTTYSNTNFGAIQSQAYDIALAQQIKADDPAAKLLLDFHYSDTWADPGDQAKPSAWTGATTMSALESDVQTYTTSTLTAFKTAGVMPDMVQLGNENTNGMLFQTGTTGAAAVGGQIFYAGNKYAGTGNKTATQAQENTSWQNFGALLNSAIAGVRAVQGTGPRIPVALSIDSGDMNDQPQSFYAELTSPTLGDVTDFDIEGVDYYPSSNNSNKSFAFLQSNLTALANTNFNANPTNPKKIMVLESDYPYTGTANSGTDPISMWPATPAGQEAEFLAIRNTVMNLPHNDGEGALYWYPEAVFDQNFSINNSGNTALFDSNGNALAALSPTSGAFNVTGTITATWVTNQDADWNTTTNWLGGAIPNGIGAEADLLSTITAAHTLSSSAAITLGSLYLNNTNSYTLTGTGSLTMQVSSGSALIDVLSGSHTINLPLTIASNTTLSIASGASLLITAPITVNSSQSLIPSGTGTVTYQSNITLQSAASITFTSSFHATGLSLTTSSTASIAAHGTNPKSLVQLDQLSFGGSTNAWQGTIDLTNNDLIVHNGNLTNITNQIAEGFNHGSQTGAAGIISSVAVAAGNTTLGVELNNDGNNNPLLSTFDGQSVTTTDVLVKYTYFGDANLDGVINGSDYTLIDNGFNTGLTGWRNGDFNYDGVINGDDYLLIDNAFNTQAAPLLAGATPTNQIAALPEPSMGIVTIMTTAIFLRRRRSQSL